MGSGPVPAAGDVSVGRFPAGSGLLDGIITVHRDLPVHRGDPAVDLSPRIHPETTRPAYGPEQHHAALDRRRSDIADLAGVSTALDDVDRRTVDLNRRITELLDLVLPP